MTSRQLAIWVYNNLSGTAWLLENGVERSEIEPHGLTSPLYRDQIHGLGWRAVIDRVCLEAEQLGLRPEQTSIDAIAALAHTITFRRENCIVRNEHWRNRADRAYDFIMKGDIHD